MSISNLWMLGPVVTPGGQINQIKSYQPDPGIETLLECSDGQVDYNYAAVMMQSPKLSFETTAIARALALSGFAGLAIAAATDFWFQKIAPGGTRTGGLTSFKMTGTKGILIPTSLECEDKQPARLNMDLVLISADGLTAPIAVTLPGALGSTLPAITAADQMFVNGPISVNGTAVEGVKSTRVDFGFQLVVEHGSGEAYPTFVGIRKRQPRITFRTTDVTLLAAGAFVAAQGATDSVVYLRKMAQNGTRVPDATAEHIKFSIDDGMIYKTTVGGGSEEEPQMSQVTIEPTWDGTNDVVALSTASAIT